MTDFTTIDAYGVLTEADTLIIQRVLPGPVERIWAYLTDSDLRRQWLASGEMPMTVGAPFELEWHNDELSQPAGDRPDGMPEKHQMPSHIVAADPPRKLVIAWRNTGDVTFELEPHGDEVLLTLTHERFASRSSIINHAAGWHAHLDILAARARGETSTNFWDQWRAFKDEYERRIPADAAQS
jgi:uncharacterized protein YndB with AHSA1/START domain